MSDTPFEVTDEIETGDMSDVQEDLLPASSKVLFSIKKASVDTITVSKEDKTPTLKKIRLQAKLVEGIEVTQDGVTSIKYKGKVSFIDFLVWHNPEFKKGNWYESRKYMLPYKQFLIAMKYDTKNSPKINDELLGSWKDLEFRCDVLQKPIQVEKRDEQGNKILDENDKTIWVDTSDLKNEYKNFRAA